MTKLSVYLFWNATKRTEVCKKNCKNKIQNIEKVFLRVNKNIT